MPPTHRSPSPRSPTTTLRRRRWVILGLAALVVGLGAWWTHRAFETQLDSGRAQTLTRLLATSHAPRMVEAPGVEAWLLDLLQEAGVDEALLRPARDPPPEMRPVGARLHQPPPSTPPARAVLVDPPAEAIDATHQLESLRLVKHLHLGEQTLVLTRRRGQFEAELEPDLQRAAAHLVAIADAWARPTAADGEAPLPHLIRLYAIMEDGSFLSLPFPEPARPDEPRPHASALEEETLQSQRRPRAPSLVSGGAFLDLDFGQSLDAQTHYSGVYTDVGGSGFVATVSVPMQYADNGAKLVIAADVAVEVELQRLVDAAGPYLRLTVTEPVPLPDSPWWQPWSTLAGRLRPDVPEALRREVQEQVLREGREQLGMPLSPVVHRRLDSGRGALFALQVRRHRWLVGWAVETPASVPWGPMVVIPGLLVLLLVWAERRWARSEAERDSAHAALELLGIPLVIVDPNDDTVVWANAAADALGLRPGRSFGDEVAPDPGSRSHYQHEQVAGRRRAYGVHLRQSDGRPARFALVRSISLSEPLPGLGAAHHRLGLVIVVDDEAELAPVLDERDTAARQDERDRLATLLDHGADTLARVLARRLEHARSEDELAFCRWLAEYLLWRLRVGEWVLGHWGGAPRLEAQRILGPRHLHGTLERYEQIFAVVRDDDRLRAQLHWSNGMLASPAPGGGVASPVIESEVDWPDGYRLTMPTDGVFGFLLGELLVNAVEHGAPGSTMELEAVVDRGRRELDLRLSNPVVEASGPSEPRDKAYGGRVITKELARLCGWTLTQGPEGGAYVVRLVCPLTQQREATETD